jgi:hypothetical protein
VAVLPETAAVYWRPRVDDRRLRIAAWQWTATTVAHVAPFCAVAVLLFALEPLSFPVGLAALAHAWLIPELYAARGATSVRPKRRYAGAPAGEAQEQALGLLGDLVGHRARDLYARSGLLLERGRLGVWLVGTAGALLVRPGGRRVHCWCVGVDTTSIPAADRVSHLLLALRADEQGFATVANQTFSGARWRVRRRLPAEMRPALDEAALAAWDNR